MHEFLLFSTALGQRLVSVESVVEVIPFVKLQQEQSDNPLFRGLLNYRGQILPVFDFMAAGNALAEDYSSFLVVLDGEQGLFSLVAQEVNQLLQVAADDVFAVNAAAGAPFAVAKAGDAMIRIVSVGDFLA